MITPAADRAVGESSRLPAWHHVS